MHQNTDIKWMVYGFLLGSISFLTAGSVKPRFGESKTKIYLATNYRKRILENTCASPSSDAHVSIIATELHVPRHYSQT